MQQDKSTHAKIKQLREIKNLTQSQMAEMLHISANAYGRLERGETEMTERKLEQIAKILEISDFTKIISTPSDKMVFLLNAESSITESNIIGHYAVDAELKFQNEKLTLLLAEKDKLLAAKDEQIATLQALVSALQK